MVAAEQGLIRDGEFGAHAGNRCPAVRHRQRPPLRCTAARPLGHHQAGHRVPCMRRKMAMTALHGRPVLACHASAAQAVDFGPDSGPWSLIVVCLPI